MDWKLAMTSALLPLSFSLSLAAQGGTQGQTPPVVGGARFVEAWVDPYNGSDGLAAVGAADRPYRTLNAAIAAVALTATPANPGLVHANPGIYSFATNTELLPIVMRDNVTVQAVDFKSCVIRGDGQQDGLNIFYPLDQGNCTCGSRALREVLVDLTNCTDSGYVEKFDSFTLQGGDVQVYAEAEGGEIEATVSNCLFDMIEEHDASVSGPQFGVLMVHPYVVPEIGGYYDIPVNLLNNTFIQTFVNATGSPPQVFSARSENVAIADTNDPRCQSANGDPDHRLRGVGRPNIQNNLIRSNQVLTPNVSHTAMLGIDQTDTTALVPALAFTNAFDPTQAVSVTGLGTYCSLIQGGIPMPAINPNPSTGGTDPRFVGESLTQLLGLSLTMGRDWRLLPNSPMRGLGLSPVLAPGSALTALNGSSYVVGLDYPEWSFAFDGEGYGNLRVRGGMDIGCDQVGRLIACGFGNDNRNANGPLWAADPTPNGIGGAYHIYDGPGTYTTFRVETQAVATGFNTPTSPPGYFWAYSCQFGCLAPPSTGPLPSALPDNWVWVDTVSGFPLVSPPSPLVASLQQVGIPYVPTADPTAPGLPIYIDFPLPAAPGSYVNDQVFFTPLGSSHGFVPGSALSNVQSYRH